MIINSTKIFLILPLFTDSLLMIRFPQWLGSKESTCNAGDTCSIPGLGRSSRGGHGNSLQYSCCGKNPMDRGAWQATVHRVRKSQTRVKQGALQGTKFKNKSYD